MNNSLKLENRHTGEILWLRRFRLESGEEALQLKGSLPPGQEGPPLHYHVFETEEGTIIKGKLGAQVNGRTLTVEPGQKAVFPAGVLHNWWNAGDELLEFEGTSSPAVDLDRYLQAVFAVLNAGKPDRPDLFYFAHVAHRHRKTQFAASMPRLLQRILFPIIILIGTVSGKYKGNDWPGAPAACPGAPRVNS